MVSLAKIELGTALRHSSMMLESAKDLLTHIGKTPSLPHQEQFQAITDYMVGELEKGRDAAYRMQVSRLASATRNLFELALVVDFVCGSDLNMARFINDAAIDEKEIIEKLEAIDRRDQNYDPDPSSQSRAEKLKQQIADGGLKEEPPLLPFDIAKAVNREEEYKELYKVYSKMTHATAWIILGKCEWKEMVKFLLVKANSYAAECFKRIAAETGFVSPGAPGLDEVRSRLAKIPGAMSDEIIAERGDH